MDLPEWNFSKESQPDLEKFLAVVENQTCNDNIQQIFDQFLPDLIQQQSNSAIIEQHIIKPTINDIEIIIIDDKETVINPIISEQILDLSTSLAVDDQILNSDIQDFIKYIQESFETDGTKLEDVIIKLSGFDDFNIEHVFKTLYTSLSDQGLFLLNHSIVNCSKISMNVAKLFSKYVLLSKLNETDPTSELNSLLIEFSRSYPEITRKDLLIPVFLKDLQFSKWEDVALNILVDNEKDLFLKDFVYVCKELESWQIPTLKLLISSQTEDFVKRRLINLIDTSCDKFVKEKMFLKFLITLIQCLGAGFEDLEELLHNVIEKNKTLLKNQARRALEDWSKVYNNINRN